jgi:hypothetical protein
MLLGKLLSVHLPALKRLEIQFQYASKLMTFQRGGSDHGYQRRESSFLAKNCEPWFQTNLANLDRLRKAFGELATNQEEDGHEMTKAPSPLNLEIEHSEADSTEVIPGISRRCDKIPGFRVPRDDPSLDSVQSIQIKCCNVSLRKSNEPPRHFGGARAIKQRLFDLNQAMLRRRNENLYQRVSPG